MKRVIRFRGKSKHEDVWLYGWLMQATDWSIAMIQEFEGKRGEDGDLCAEVIPKTVGQFTGLCDCDGKEIYEGDIVEFTYKKLNEYGSAFSTTQKVIGEIATDEYGNHYISSYNLAYHISNIIDGKAKVIGNIFDTPELLKGGCNGSY